MTASPPPTPQAVDAAITPGLRPLEKALHACALAHPEIALFLEETPASSLNIRDGRLGFRLGEPPGSAEFAAPLGSEEITVIVNPDNPAFGLSAQNLSDLFSGQITGWQELGAASLPVQAWIYPEGDEVRSLFDAAVLHGKGTTPLARLAPDPQAMLEAVSSDAGAIGYLPHAWLVFDENTHNVKKVRLEEGLTIALRQPVLALSAGQPVPAAAHTLLSCLQGDPGRQALREFYERWKP